METSSLPDYPEKASPSMPVGASDSIRRRSGDRLVASLLRLSWIAIILGALAMLRSAALSASGQAQRHPPETSKILGEWEQIDGAGRCLKFSPDGVFQETTHDGKPIQSGPFSMSGNSIRISYLLDENEQPKNMQWDREDTWMTKLELEFLQKNDSLVVTRRRAEWRYADGVLAHKRDSSSEREVYKRRNPPPADPAIDKPIGAAP